MKKLLTAFVGIAIVFCGCSYHNFPVLQPVPVYDRQTEASFRAETYFIQGRNYERRKLTLLAESCYEAAFELQPNSPLLRSMLVDIYIKNGRYPQALVLLKNGRPLQALGADQLRSVASISIKMAKPAEALEALELISPPMAEDHLAMGVLYESSGFRTKAISHFSLYYNQHPEAIELGFKLADLYQQAGRLGAVESIYGQIEAVSGVRPEIFNGLARIDLIRKDTAAALLHYQQALAIDSMNIDALHNGAQIFIRIDRFSDAIKNYERLYAADVAIMPYGRILGILYYYEKQFVKAESLFRKILAADSGDYEAHFYYGLIRSALNQNDSAAVEFKKALAIRPQYLDVWQYLCYAAIKVAHYDSALSIALRCTAAMPGDAQSWRLLGYARSVRKEYPASVEALRRAVGLDSTDANIWFDLGSAYERMQNYDEAARSFRRVLHIRPDDATAANYLGYMWVEQKMHLDSAQVLIEKALSLEPGNGAFLDSYAWLFYTKDDYSRAYEYGLKAFEKLADDPTVSSHLGDILVKMGKPEQAVDIYRKSIKLGSEEKAVLEAKIRSLLELR
jgi:tetratricopeptide (TPR) repeat protein